MSRLEAEVSACPACLGLDSSQVGGLATAFDTEVGGRVFSHPAYTVRHCATCGLYFKSRVIPVDALEDYYRRLDCSAFEWGDGFPTDQRLSRLLAREPQGHRVLDFGCSTGRMLKNSVGRLECYGVEPNERAAALAREKGIMMVTEAQLRAGGVGAFDLVILADVYEHLAHPPSLVALLAGLLRPGGRLAIVTGNADAVHPKGYIAEHWYFRVPSHLLMISRAHIEWLAERTGLETDSVHSCCHYDPPVAARVAQYVRSGTYLLFQRFQRGPVAKLLNTIPVLNRARHWRSAPALNCTNDHVVAILRRSEADARR